MEISRNNIRQLKKIAQLHMAALSFWEYCKVKDPKFYKEDRIYLKTFCDTLQKFAESGEANLLLAEMPPRVGKSYTLQHFTQWLLGRYPDTKIMTASYNERLSTTFAKAVRNAIMERKAEDAVVVFSDIFPNVKIKDGDASMDMWSLEGHYANYLATSPNGSATGFGASVIIVDDLIRNALEAFNDRVKQEHYDWFTQTMLSRLEEGGKIIICATRWAEDDLTGRMINAYKEQGKQYLEVKFPAVYEDGSMLCEEILSKQSMEDKRRLIGEEIFMANYQQTPINLKGRLYTNLKTYDDVPRDGGGHPLFTAYKAYVDTADKGADYLCCICYGVYDHNAYILDVIYNNKPMEITEPLVAECLDKNKIRDADIESNNGGRGFARNVDRLLREEHENHSCVIHWFTQTKNKEARILSNSTTVMEHVFFPMDWTLRWREFAEAIYSYQKEGKNLHDDAPDALTGVVEKSITRPPIRLNPAILHSYRI